MAMTGRARTERRGLDGHAPCPARRRAAAVAAVLALSTPAALAQRWSVEPAISTLLTWSSNPELGVGDGREDLLFEVRPRVALRGETPNLRVNGSAALSGVWSARGTQPNRLLPEADLNGRLEAIPRFFFVEAGVRALQTAENPFGALPESSTTRNTVTATQVRIAPSIESTIGPFTRYRVRSDNTWTRESGSTQAAASTGEGYFARHTALIESDPRPLGWRLEAERSETRYREGLQDSLTLDLVRASVDYAFGVDLTAGVRAGRERTSFVASDSRWRNIYGLQAHWQPSPRTNLTGFAEKRFFGNAWRLGFNHRLSRIAWNALLSRSLDTTPQSLFDLPPTANVSLLLDAMLAPRFPDPLERARVVDDLIARQGLPASTVRPTSIFFQRLSVETLRQVSVVMSGRRNTITLAAFGSRTEDAPEAGALATGEALTNNRQHGTSATWTYQLTPQTALTAGGEWTRIRALRTEERSIRRTARLQANTLVTPRTTVFGGARLRDVSSNVVNEGSEKAVFIGMDHRF